MDAPIKGSHELATGRTVLAMDRTLLAWVRTALSLISFGFTIYKVLQTFQKEGVAGPLNPSGPRNLGLFLILLGTIPLAMTSWQFSVTMRRQLGVSRRELLRNPSLLVAATIALLGLFLFFTIVTHLEVV